MKGGKTVTVGLTGLTGAGKSTVAGLFAQRGFAVIDADALAHRVTQKGSPALAELSLRFGKNILLPDGSLDRRDLASVAFSSPENTRALGEITHPHILSLMKEEAEKHRAAGVPVLLDAPLLFECGLEKICDFTVTVVCPRETRIKRLEKRDNIPREAIEKRMNAQSTEEYQTKKSDYVITNDGKAELAGQVEYIINNIK